VSHPWLAKRLAIGHTAAMSKATSLYQDSEEGRKRIKHHEKILVSKNPIHFAHRLTKSPTHFSTQYAPIEAPIPPKAPQKIANFRHAII
jgi:hypothetical protein